METKSASFLRKAYRIIKLGSLGMALFIAALLFYWLVAQPLVVGWRLHQQLVSALDEAVTVKIVEHSNRYEMGYRPDYKEVTYATRVLTPEEIAALRSALATRLDYSEQEHLNCVFEDHHTINVLKKDGTTLELRLCFHCEELRVGGGERVMPWGWASSLRKFVSSLGMHPDGPWDNYPNPPH